MSKTADQRKKTVVTVISKISDQPAGKSACLVMIYGSDLGKKFNLEKPSIIIGRSAKCDIQIDQESVSRSHAKLVNSGGVVEIRDMGSTNGTYLFKQINDSFGHLAGDHVLKQLAQLIRRNIRREDFIARYGGEEFAIILPEIDHPNALAMAEKVRKLVEQAEMSFDNTAIPTTISLGVATLADESSEAADLIRRADEFLYQAKRAGRNRVAG